MLPSLVTLIIREKTNDFGWTRTVNRINTLDTYYLVADPGFSQSGRQLKGWGGGTNLLFGQIFLKLNENEKKWTGAGPKFYYVDLSLLSRNQWLGN